MSQSSDWKIQAVRSALDRLLFNVFEFHCELTLHNSHQYQCQKLALEVHQGIPLLDKLNYPHASSFILAVFSPVHQLERNGYTLKINSEFTLEREKPWQLIVVTVEEGYTFHLNSHARRPVNPLLFYSKDYSLLCISNQSNRDGLLHFQPVQHQCYSSHLWVV